jgi:hypothetical protein
VTTCHDPAAFPASTACWPESCWTSPLLEGSHLQEDGIKLILGCTPHRTDLGILDLLDL